MKRYQMVVVAAIAALLAVFVPGTSGAFVAKVVNSQDTGGASTRFTCTDTFNDATNATNAYFEYRSVASGTAQAPDISTAGNGGTYVGTGPHPATAASTTTACPASADGSYYYAPDGSSNWIQTSKITSSPPASFSLATWFTTTKAGGYLLGLNSDQTSTDTTTQRDRHLYIDSNGKLVFGVNSSGIQVITSPSVVNDGKWHQVVATLSPSTGMQLWLDGVSIGTKPGVTTAQAYNGYWRIAFGPLAGSWPNSPSSTYFQGGMRFTAAYKFVLSDAEIAAEYRNGKPNA